MASADDKNFDDINVTPMVDLYLVLLLIFIIMTTAAVKGMKVDLPRPSKNSVSKPNPNAPKLQAIVIDNSGKIKLNGEDVSFAQLETKLAAARTASAEVPAVVRGDRQTQYQTIMDVLDLLGRLKITKIGLATKPPEK
ncbi:biopolymer transporter ExbD [Haloferula sp. BvORR071]|uniref:ExbD/TolR family protein n=1 Tax=Haloferula sp. BvORR071 TaxID=1396141 RepID=UPI00054E369C|nr:biopolymer transporter ExbD [Haloferula sp. BvORR071]